MLFTIFRLMAKRFWQKPKLNLISPLLWCLDAYSIYYTSLYLHYISIFCNQKLCTTITIFKTETFVKWKQDNHTCAFNFQIGAAQYDLFALSEKYNNIFFAKDILLWKPIKINGSFFIQTNFCYYLSLLFLLLELLCNRQNLRSNVYKRFVCA